jgi:phenylacetate-CoA ligase
MGHWIYGRVTGFAPCLRLMNHSQWNRREDLQQIQFQLVKSIAQYAANHVPYYVGLFKQYGISPNVIRDLDEFARIPILTKSMIRPAYPTQICRRSSWLDLKTVTSGSTGEPFESIIDGKTHCWRLAARYLFDSWIGITPGENWLRVRIIPERSAYARFAARLRAEHWVQVTVGPDAKPNLQEVIKQVDKNRPSGIFGPASTLALLAKYIQDTGHMPSHKVKGVYSTMETLLTYQRESISSVLSQNLFDRYGLREFGGYLAQDCENHDGLHVNPFLAYAEVVRDDGTVAEKGEVGRLVITDLRNHAMPFIRYDTGDLATISDDCQCGRGFPSLGKIIGRESEYIRTKFGLLSSLMITDDFGGSFSKYVRAFQFIQLDSGNVLVKVVPTAALDRRFHTDASQFLSKFLHDFELQLVSEIDPEPSGKIPAFKSARSTNPTCHN